MKATQSRMRKAKARRENLPTKYSIRDLLILVASTLIITSFLFKLITGIVGLILPETTIIRQPIIRITEDRR